MGNSLYSVGDRVRVADCRYGHKFDIGEIVTIDRILTDSYIAKRDIENFSDRDWWYVYDDELDRVARTRAMVV